MRPRNHSSLSRGSWRIARWPIFLVLSAVLFFIIGISTVRETYRAWQIDQQIHDLQAQVDALEGKKSSLLQLVDRLQSPEELDHQARAELGLRKPGERVFAIPADMLAAANPVTAPHPTSTSSETVSNPAKWFRYFFRDNDS